MGPEKYHTFFNREENKWYIVNDFGDPVQGPFNDEAAAVTALNNLGVEEAAGQSAEAGSDDESGD